MRVKKDSQLDDFYLCSHHKMMFYSMISNNIICRESNETSNFVAGYQYKATCSPYQIQCTVVMSMFASSKWQHVALPLRWRASVRALFYCYHTFLDHTTNISQKVCAPRCVNVSGAPNDVPNCHLDKTTMDNSPMHLELTPPPLSDRRSWQGWARSR